jgi:cytochrome o ubiquinol oxidase subunit 2
MKTSWRRMRAATAALPACGLAGCAAGVLDPRGPVGHAERTILFDSVAIMLTVVLPVIVATLAFAWWFRASNSRARYLPEWAYSGRVEFIVWSIPALIILFLGGVTWISSHELDPFQPIRSENAPVEVEVVSLDWKWLFIYPDQGVASVNHLVIPAATPVHFHLTAATVMNSFFVPQLGSQIYTMPGMTTQLNLLADRPGDYPGLSAQFSGDGFADMHFDVQAMTPADFRAWVDGARHAGGMLDTGAYRQFLQPGTEPRPRTFGAVEPGLFQTILRMTTASAEMPPQQAAGHSPMQPEK